MTADTIFDCTSLTKILVTWSAIGKLYSSNRVRLDTALGEVLPETIGYDLERITLLELLTHTAGLPLRSKLNASVQVADR